MPGQRCRVGATRALLRVRPLRRSRGNPSSSSFIALRAARRKHFRGYRRAQRPFWSCPKRPLDSKKGACDQEYPSPTARAWDPPLAEQITLSSSRVPAMTRLRQRQARPRGPGAKMQSGFDTGGVERAASDSKSSERAARAKAPALSFATTGRPKRREFWLQMWVSKAARFPPRVECRGGRGEPPSFARREAKFP